MIIYFSIDSLLLNEIKKLKQIAYIGDWNLHSNNSHLKEAIDPIMQPSLVDSTM